MDNKNRYQSVLSSIYRNIQYYKEIIISSSDPDEKMYYESILYNESIRLNYWQNYNSNNLST